MPNKLTDNEIIKALECCKNSNCLNCPFNISKEENQVLRVENCVATMKTLSFDLINRLQAENERLRKDRQKLDDELYKALESAAINRTKLIDTKAEAYKEFAERLKETVGEDNAK